MRDSDDESLPGGHTLNKRGEAKVSSGNGVKNSHNHSVANSIQRKYRRQSLRPTDLHSQRHHGHEKLFFCTETGCGRAFSSKFKMMRHMLIHSGERQFQCSLCDRCFHRKDHLKNHLQVHNPNKVIHTCNHCGKRYSSLLSYRKHLALHAAESGDLSCKLCGKIFEGKEQIMYHLKVHSGSRALKGPSERKYKCDQCDRCFFTRKDVKRHMVVHTGVRNFFCQFCPQRFGRKDHLVRHIKKSHAAQAAAANANNVPKDNNGCSSKPSSTMHHPNQNHHHHPVSSSNEKQVLNRSTPHAPVPMTSQPSHSLESAQSSFSPFHTMHSMHSALQDSCPTYISMKQEPCFQTLQNAHALDHPTSSSAISSSTNSCQPLDDGDHLLKLSDVSQMIPVTQFYPLASNCTFPSGVPHLLPSNCYFTSVAGSSHLLPTLPPDTVLQPISSTGIPFSAPMSLDVGPPSLPHFNQAFQ